MTLVIIPVLNLCPEDSSSYKLSVTSEAPPAVKSVTCSPNYCSYLRTHLITHNMLSKMVRILFPILPLLLTMLPDNLNKISHPNVLINHFSTLPETPTIFCHLLIDSCSDYHLLFKPIM